MNEIATARQSTARGRRSARVPATGEPADCEFSRELMGKRAFDFAVALVGLIVVAPLLAVVVILIRVDSPGPVFFSQMRLGRGGRLFRLLKFRTMTDRLRRPSAEVLPSNVEVTRVGRILRRLKIDEVPQLWNVLVGDMSLVGPRPALPEQREELDETGRQRLRVRPGLTGLAQVHGNIYLSWQERWKYDAQYVERLSWGMDGWILAKTILVVVAGEERWTKKPPQATSQRERP